jgi:hypothetical protein
MTDADIPTRPTTYRHPYHQMLVSKLMVADKADFAKDVPFPDVLEVLGRMHALTGGMPHICYLTGWQHAGHDSKYPDWSEVNDRLKRPEDATARDSILWLMRAARPLNTTVSVHINMCDAYETSPLWDAYRREDLLVRNKDGSLAKGGIWGGEQSYWVSKAREWASGRSRRRIDGLLELLPLAEQGTVHIDVFSPNPSAYHQVTMAEEVQAMHGILGYWRDHGVDVTKEWFHHEFTGEVPMAWHFNLDEASRLKLPADVACGGGDEWNSRWNRTVFARSASATPEGGCLYEAAWGRSIDHDVRADLKGFCDAFCTKTVPWHFLNRRRPVEHVHTPDRYEVRFTGRVRTEVQTASRRLRLWWEDRLLADGADLCVPAPWLRGEAGGPTPCLAYSRDGATREWPLPPDWSGVRSAAVAVPDPPRAASVRDADVSSGGAIRLDLPPGRCAHVRPA